VTFSEILLDVYARTNKPPTPEGETVARIKRFVNQRHRTLLTTPGIDQFRDSTSTIASVSGTARTALPQAVAKIKAVIDPVSCRRLAERDLDWLRSVDPQQTSGTPTHFIPLGYQYVAAQPSNASAVYVKSSSASDTGTAYIEGIRTGGILGSSRVTMTGTTAVAVGSFTDWIEITKFYVNPSAVGSITLHEDSGVGTELAQITIGRVRPYYFIVLLWPTPSAVVTYTVDYTREVVDMVQDTDEPYLPTDYHDLLSIGGRMDEYEKMDDSRYSTAKRDYKEKYDSLQFFIHSSASERLIPRSSSGRTGFSDLGGFFPADVYVP
jgi:hypothetical protein